MTRFPSTYLIDYDLYSNTGDLIKKGGVISVKNKDSEQEAREGLEKYLRKKNKDFGKLIINSCTEENFMQDFFNILGITK